MSRLTRQLHPSCLPSSPLLSPWAENKDLLGDLWLNVERLWPVQVHVPLRRGLLASAGVRNITNLNDLSDGESVRRGAKAEFAGASLQYALKIGGRRVM
jgi:hypothetical protein